MSDRYRIGTCMLDVDWYWQQVQEGMQQRAQELGVELVSLEQIEAIPSTFPEDSLSEMLAQQPSLDLDALVCMSMVNNEGRQILDSGLPMISLTETPLRHPLLVSPESMEEIAYHLGLNVAERLHGKGTVLLVGGLLDTGEAGRGRIAGFLCAFQAYPEIRIEHIPCVWGYSQAYKQSYPVLLRLNALDTPIDAIIGLLDPLALATRDAARALDLLRPETIIAGLGGFPEALEALARGDMHFSVDLYPFDFGRRALDLAVQAGERCINSTLYPYQWRLLTAPSPALVEPENAYQRLSSIEVVEVISRLNSVVLERHQLVRGIVGLLRAQYGYDQVHILRWLPEEQTLVVESLRQDAIVEERLALSDAPLLEQALLHNGAMYIADAEHNARFAPDLRWPQTRTRLIIPLFHTHGAVGSSAVVGLLDCHCAVVRPHTVDDINCLNSIAEHIGPCLRSSELYYELLQAHAVASDTQSTVEPGSESGVLIVDGDVSCCERYRRLAAQTFPDTTVYTATSGATALQLLSRIAPQLVILDLLLPDLDGFAVLEHLRASPRTHRTPVLVLSRHTLSSEEVQRLNDAQVIFQSKDLLSHEEMPALFQHVLAGPMLGPQMSFLMKQFVAYLQHHYARNLLLPEIATALGVSKRHLTRIVHQEFGTSPKELLNRYRIQQAAKLLQSSSASVKAIAYQVGFDDPDYFSRVFRLHTGYLPSTYREQGYR